MKRIGRESLLTSSNFLFGLRIFPFAVSAVVTLLFTLLSFWLLEQASPDEDAATFALAACSLLILTAGLSRVLRAQTRTTRAMAQWLMGTPNLGGDPHTPRLRAAHGAPPLILVGFRQPRVMVSDAAAAVLSDDELQVAVRHELGHARSWDNLKRILISSTPFPGMGGLERAWQEAAELAADDTAVRNRQEALDLAAALIKLSRFGWQSPAPVLATGLVGGSSSISVRVDRLLKWRMAGHPFRRTWPWTLPPLLTVIAGVAVNYGATLVLTHRLTELLVP
jgi:Zn-dependent protease with chaperone function